MAKQTIQGPGDGGSPNYTPTPDPKVVIGKHGATITYDDFVNANKNGYAWKDFPAYADYVGGWAKPLPKESVPPPPYYRHYPAGPNIPTAAIELLKARYADDPKVGQLLQRNAAKPGEVPMYGPDDGDVIKALIAKEQVQAQASHDPNYGLANAVANAKGR